MTTESIDSDNWEIYNRSLNGDKNRFKLRIRYYNEKEMTPVFWEIKRRMKDVILKQRCAIRRSAAQAVVWGPLPAPADTIMPDDPAELKAIHEFFKLQHDLNAVPKMDVAYEREAYVSATNNEFRVTFDRHVRVQPRPDGLVTTKMPDPFVCTGPGTTDPDDVVIFELKFTERFPNWYRDLVRSFNLMQMGAAKFVEGTLMHAGRHLHARDVIRNMVL